LRCHRSISKPQNSLRKKVKAVPDDADTSSTQKSWRPVRTLGACVALVVGLLALALGIEIILEQYVDLLKYGNATTGYGWAVLAKAGIRLVVAASLFWLVVRLLQAKPLPLVGKRA